MVLPVIKDVYVTAEPIPIRVCERKWRVEDKGWCFH
jgi:hypothetical protein